VNRIKGDYTTCIGKLLTLNQSREKKKLKEYIFGWHHNKYWGGPLFSALGEGKKTLKKCDTRSGKKKRGGKTVFTLVEVNRWLGPAFLFSVHERLTQRARGGNGNEKKKIRRKTKTAACS